MNLRVCDTCCACYTDMSPEAPGDSLCETCAALARTTEAVNDLRVSSVGNAFKLLLGALRALNKRVAKLEGCARQQNTASPPTATRNPDGTHTITASWPTVTCNHDGSHTITFK